MINEIKEKQIYFSLEFQSIVIHKIFKFLYNLKNTFL